MGGSAPMWAVEDMSAVRNENVSSSQSQAEVAGQVILMRYQDSRVTDFEVISWVNVW